MKMMFLTTAAALCLGMGTAAADSADSEGGPTPNTFFSELPGVIAIAPGQLPNNVAVNSYFAPSNTATAVNPPRSPSNSGS
jgi:hypothetical protein